MATKNSDPSDWSLRTIVGGAIALSLLVFALLTGYLVSSRIIPEVEREAGRSLEQLAAQVASGLDAAIMSRASVVGTIVSSGLHEDPRAAGRFADALAGSDQALAWLGFMDREGNVIASSRGILRGDNIAERPVFREGIKGFFIGDVHLAVRLAAFLRPDPSGEPMRFVDVAMPIPGPDDRPIGVVAAHFDWRWARDVATRVAVGGSTRRTSAVLLGADGDVLAGPDELVGRKLGTSSSRAVLSGRYWRGIETWPDGRRYMVATAKASTLPWGVLAIQPAESLESASRSMQETIVLLGVMVGAMVGVMGWIAAGAITRPIRRIAISADAIRHGNRNARIPVIHGIREVSSLASSLGSMMDMIRSQSSANAALRALADQDALTGLPNRRAMDAWIERMTGTDVDAVFGVICLDLNGFKPVNDTYGHAAGDIILREVAVRLSSCLRAQDALARTGGDEFVVLLSTCTDIEETMQVASRMMDAFGPPFRVGDASVNVGCSMGVALRLPGDVAEAVLEAADAALYKAKERKGGAIVVAPGSSAIRIDV